MQPTDTSHEWTDPSGGRWLIYLTWIDRAGRLECVNISVSGPEVAPGVPLGTPIPPGLLRQIPLGALLDRGRREAPLQAYAESVISDAPEPGFSLHGSRRRVPTRDEYRMLRVAVTYSRAGHRPAIAVAEDLQIARSTARRYVERARHEYGFLEPTTQRTVNHRLTPKALRLLERFGDDWQAWEAAIDNEEKK